MFEEPRRFLLSVEELYSEGYQHSPLGSPVHIRSESVYSKRSSAAPASMLRLTGQSSSQDYFLETRYLLASSPLTELILEGCRLDNEAAHALTRIIQNCTTLKTLRIVYCTRESTNFTPILSAVSESTSIRKFSFQYDGRNLDCGEFDSILRLIRSSRTLRILALHDIFCSISHLCRALAELISNTSIWKFDSLLCENLPPWPEAPETEKAALTTLLLQLMSNNFTLTDFQIFLAIQGSYLNLNEDVLLQAFQRSITLSSIFLVDRDGGVIDDNSIHEVHYLNAQAANVVKIGRLFSGDSLVCGLRIPTELVDAILREVTSGSVWNDGMWRVIRRVAVDRRTIGRLMTNSEPFDAYELLYRCRSLF